MPAGFEKIALPIVGPQFVLPYLLVVSASAAVESEFVVGELPAGYHLQAYDDCGIGGHQPHALTPDLHTFEPDRVQADERARSVTFGRPNFDMVFENLAEDVPYVLAITYASEKSNSRVQSLSAGTVVLHGKHRLPDGTAERLFFKIPTQSIADGKLILHFILNEGPNAVVSEVGLWAPLPSPEKLNLEATPTLAARMKGLISDLSYHGLPQVAVEIMDEAGTWLESVATQTNGAFAVDLSHHVKFGSHNPIRIRAKRNRLKAEQTVSSSDLWLQLPSFCG